MPAYNEAGVIGQTLKRIATVAARHPDIGPIEVVVVSDGSSDSTFEESASHLADGVGGMVIQLAKNSGSHAAIRCGLRHVRGQAVAIMAADGQDPPENLPAMLAVIGNGIEVVWGRRKNRSGDPLLRRGLARTYYWIFHRLTGFDYPPAGLDFVVMSRRVAEVVGSHAERNASLFLLIYNLGFGQESVDYERLERSGGTSRWTFRKRAKLAVDMLTGFSAAPIRIVSALGILVGLIGLVLGGLTVVRGLLGRIPVSGWASLMVVSSLMSGLLLVAIGFLGEYIWRTLDEVRGRPLFLESRQAVMAAAADLPQPAHHSE